MRKDIIESVTEPKKDDLWLSPEGLKKFGKKGWELLDKNITSSTPIINEVQGNELVPIQQDGENKAVSVDALIKGGKEVYVFDIEQYKTPEDFNNLKAAVDAGKIIMNNNYILDIESITDTSITAYGYVEQFLNNVLVIFAENGSVAYDFSRGLIFNCFYDTHNKKLSLANYSQTFVYLKNNYFGINLIPCTIKYGNIVYRGVIYDVTNSPISAPVISIVITSDSSVSHYDKGKIALFNRVFNVIGDLSYTIPTDDFLKPASIVLDASSDGTKFLSDNGTYKEIDITSATPYIFNYTGQTSVTQEEYDGLKAAIEGNRTIIVNYNNQAKPVGDCSVNNSAGLIAVSFYLGTATSDIELVIITESLVVSSVSKKFATEDDLTTKQDKISDLDTIRANAALGATALQEETYKGTYTKPSTGIPKTDLASAVQTSLDKADTALQSVPTPTDTTLGGVKQVTVTKLAEDADITTVVTAYNDLIDKLVTSGIAVIS